MTKPQLPKSVEKSFDELFPEDNFDNYDSYALIDRDAIKQFIAQALANQKAELREAVEGMKEKCFVCQGTEFNEGSDGEAFCIKCEKYSKEWMYKGVEKNKILYDVLKLFSEDGK